MAYSNWYNLSARSNRLPRRGNGGYIAPAADLDQPIEEVKGFLAEFWSRLVLCVLSYLVSVPMLVISFSVLFAPVHVGWKSVGPSVFLLLMSTLTIIAATLLPFKWYRMHRIIQGSWD